MSESTKNDITANIDYTKLYNLNYYRLNKDKLSERRKICYQQNKKDILEQRRQTYYSIACFNKIECGFCKCDYIKK